MHQAPTTMRPTRRRSGPVIRGALAASLVAGTLGTVALVAATPDVAGAATTAVAASWSSSPNCTSYVTATPPAGTVSAALVLSGGGGGGGATNSGSGGSGGPAGEISSITVALTHGTGTVSVRLGCGGGAGSTGGGGGTSIGGAAGGAGYAAGAASGGASDEDVSVDGVSTGGGGGGASGLCIGNGNCATAVAVAGGGGGGGSRWDCTGSDGPGTGGGGQSAGTSTVSAGANGSAGGDGSSDGGGGAGGTSSAGGSGGGGATSAGATGGHTPYSSAGGAGGSGGGGFPTEAGASGGGGGGGYTGGGGGGGDNCTSGEDTGGGGGGGSSAVNATYVAGPTYTTGAAGGGTSTAGSAGSISLTWNVDDLSVTSPGTQSNVSGSAVPTLTIAAPHDTTGGNTVSFAASGLPSGLSINASTGAVTGTPTAACACAVTVTATDSEALTASTTFTWNITNSVSVTRPGNQSDVTGTAIGALTNSATDTQSGATLTWSATGLPSGLSVNPANGSVTGTPTAPCTCAVTLKATDGAGYSGTASLTWTVSNTVTVTGPGDQSDVSGAPIASVPDSATDTQSGATLTWSATGLPAGLGINASTGTVTGTPTTAGTSTVTVSAVDAASFRGSATFTWTISDTVAITDPGDQSDVSGTAISPVATGGSDTSSTTTLVFSATGLPAGLAIDPSSGTVTGTPTTACTCSVTLTATDGAAFSATTTFTWTVTDIVTLPATGAQSDVSGSPITPLALPAADTSSTATVAYSASGLPPGLSIDPATGTVSGTPTVAGTFATTVTATDDAGFSTTDSFAWTVTNTLSMTDPGDQASTSGTTVTGVPVPTTDSLPGAVLTFTDSGTLPPGLTVDPSSGTISGTPTTAGTYDVTITATDNSEFSAEVSFTWTVVNTVTVADPGAQSGVSGTTITPFTVGASDSSTTTTLAFSATGLPTGISIDPATGTVSGQPTTAGTSDVTVTATDGAGFRGTASFAWTVTNTVTVTGPGDQTGASGTSVAPVDISATDTSSTATLTYSTTGLPPGLSIDPSTGVISGTPTLGGSYPVTVSATDDASSSGSATFTWSVSDTVTVTGPGAQTSRVGSTIVPVTESATDTSTVAGLAWSATGLPPGLSIDPSTGTISGAPLHSGDFDVTVTVTDSAGFQGSTSFTWTAVGAAVTSVTKDDGPGAGGMKVRIAGSDFTGAGAVLFGSVPATGYTVNKAGTVITAYTPAEAAGTVDVVVTTPQGPSLTTPADRFTFLGPVVGSLSTAAGLTTGGTKVVIKGTDFQGTTAVHFGGVEATSFSVNKGGTKITAYSPAESAGEVYVTVTTPGGTSPTSSASLFIVS